MLSTDKPASREDVRDDVRWLVINARTRERREIEAYLYAHTTIVQTYNDGHGDVHIAVTLDPTQSPRATHLGNYQAGRLDSGWIPTTVWETFAEAVDQAFRIMAEAAR